MTADLAALFGVERREPARASGVVSIVLASVLRVDFPTVPNAAGYADVDPKAWRRAVSMAVEHAIVSPHGEAGGVVALAYLTRVDRMRKLGGEVFKKRGERKRRKAMRRLLRAAGVTVQR